MGILLISAEGEDIKTKNSSIFMNIPKIKLKIYEGSKIRV